MSFSALLTSLSILWSTLMPFGIVFCSTKIVNWICVAVVHEILYRLLFKVSLKAG